MLLVVEGGPGTLITVAEAVKTRMPVLIIEGSGRAADCVAYAWRLLHDGNPRARDYTRSGLRQRLRKLRPQNLAKGETANQWEAALKIATEDVLEIVLGKVGGTRRGACTLVVP